MVKGTARHVILVRSPDPRVFEEAIFIVREDARQNGATPDSIIREAQNVASDYIKTHVKKSLLRRLPPAAFALAGAAVTGLAWAATVFLL